MAEKFDSTHPSYDEFYPLWVEMRDSNAGETAIKAKGETYLPMPNGMKQMADGGIAAYSAYKMRAVYPEISSTTIKSFSGIINKKLPFIKVPTEIESIVKKATPDGLSIEGLVSKVIREQLSVGRIGLLADIDKNGDPTILTYKAEAIINWDEDMIMLDETGYKRNPDTYEWDEVEARRELRLIDGKYVSTRYEKIGDGWSEASTIEATKLGGLNLDYIPFVFVDTNDLSSTPDDVPLLGLARIAASMYRKSADYEASLFMTSQPTAYALGVDKDTFMEATGGVIGASALWVLPDIESKVGYLEFTGAGVNAQRQAIQDDASRAIQIGAKLFESSGSYSDRTSGDALSLRYSNQTATLVGIARTCSLGVEQCLKYLADFFGANQEECYVTIDTAFLEKNLDANEMREIRESWMAGLISKMTAYEMFQLGGRASKERSFEDEIKLIEEDLPMFDDTVTADKEPSELEKTITKALSDSN